MRFLAFAFACLLAGCAAPQPPAFLGDACDAARDAGRSAQAPPLPIAAGDEELARKVAATQSDALQGGGDGNWSTTLGARIAVVQGVVRYHRDAPAPAPTVDGMNGLLRDLGLDGQAWRVVQVDSHLVRAVAVVEGWDIPLSTIEWQGGARSSLTVPPQADLSRAAIAVPLPDAARAAGAFASCALQRAGHGDAVPAGGWPAFGTAGRGASAPWLEVVDGTLAYVLLQQVPALSCPDGTGSALLVWVDAGTGAVLAHRLRGCPTYEFGQAPAA